MRRVRPWLWVLLGAVAGWGAVSTWRRMARATDVLATTTCPFFGAPRVVVSATVSADDSVPVRIHEDVHAAQCRTLGTLGYRIRNMSSAGKLALEAPAYCAAADARLRAGIEPSGVRERLWDDMSEALRGIADSAAVDAALRAACPDILAMGRAR